MILQRKPEIKKGNSSGEPKPSSYLFLLSSAKYQVGNCQKSGDGEDALESGSSLFSGFSSLIDLLFSSYSGLVDLLFSSYSGLVDLLLSSYSGLVDLLFSSGGG